MAEHPEKRDWILAALSVKPLDRLRLMKALFLLWLDADRQIPEYFEFTAYLYGPCSFELYGELEALEREDLLTQPPSAVPRWARYHLTPQGKRASAEAVERLPCELWAGLRGHVEFAAAAGFRELLLSVYRVAPEFAARSVFAPEMDV